MISLRLTYTEGMGNLLLNHPRTYTVRSSPRTQPSHETHSLYSSKLTERNNNYDPPSKSDGGVSYNVSHPLYRNGPPEESQCQVGYCHRDHLPEAAYCKSHICGLASCVDIRALGSRYCLGHKCVYCPAAAKKESSYCRAHKCSVPSCTRGKSSGRQWCKQHACRWEGCTEDSVQGKRYCQDHACAAGDCGLHVVCLDRLLGNYCYCHSCSVEACLLRVSSRGAFCTEHECSTPGCPNPRLWDDGHGPEREHECCKYHTCVQRKCFAPVDHPGTLCDRHLADDLRLPVLEPLRA